MRRFYCTIALLLTCCSFVLGQTSAPLNFNQGWRFLLGDDSIARQEMYNDSQWRPVTLPHDWSIEGQFDEKNTSGQNEGGLPTGIGWYRKTFRLPEADADKGIFVQFDGVYRNSEVWINGHYLGKRPNGYISFQYDLTPYLNFDKALNTIAVKVDNSAQPNSRWYSGSGIYRNVWLIKTNKVHFLKDATFVTTPKVDGHSADVHIDTHFVPDGKKHQVKIKAIVSDHTGKIVYRDFSSGFVTYWATNFTVKNPKLWSVSLPNLYTVKLELYSDGKITDSYQTYIGLRYFDFDINKGFSLNGKPMKMLGVCLHHDLGALGAAVNTRAIERQLQILKAMGCNAIRTSHNPPAPELLDLCDKMGFMVMDEAFDMWKKKKTANDYHLDWDKWHVKDLQDQIKRDRNHPSVILWSVGNEIREQFDSTGIAITKELVSMVKQIDNTRPVTSALTETDPKKNFIYQSGALDILGFNYNHQLYPDLPKRFPEKPLIATETMSALETRGHYDMPSDSVRRWPADGKTKFVKDGNPDLTVSSYDNVSAYWGSTHEETWKAIKKYDFMSGLFVWTGFDYIGEPTPYPWPARSSYFGIIDLAGFPKDVYYMYQSEWTNMPVLHLFPHWNWAPGKMVDVWAYYNKADEVELFLNGKSLGIRRKQNDDLHVMWRVKYEPGTLKAVSRLKGEVVLTREIKTAGAPAKIELLADRSRIKADGNDLSYVTVKILDKDGNPVPDAANLVKFKIKGAGHLEGVDNGGQTNLDPFKADYCKAFNGLCLAIIRSQGKPGIVKLAASSAGLQSGVIAIECK